MSENPSLNDLLSSIVATDLINDASRIAGFRISGAEFASAANVSGVRTETLMFSRRHDSLTIFATDARYGHLRERGAWTGSDETAVVGCRRFLESAEIPDEEIDRIDVVAEYGQVGERLTDGDMRLREPTLLSKSARATRSIDGLPVWSSYAMVNLSERGDMGRLELHWPDVPPPVLKEAGVLRRLVDRGFEPPDLPGAKPEAVNAGVIHSPAVGFHMDINAALRVVYLGDDPSVGRKATLYLDRHGEIVVRPRDIEPATPIAKDRQEPR